MKGTEEATKGSIFPGWTYWTGVRHYIRAHGTMEEEGEVVGRTVTSPSFRTPLPFTSEGELNDTLSFS